MKLRTTATSAIAITLVMLGACSSQTSSPASPYPTKDIVLTIDDLGFTHVVAANDADAFYGAGYAMARDRLMQMEVFKRNALGTSAAILGETALKNDVGARAFGFAKLGAGDYARAKKERPDDAKLVEAWTFGVNARIDEVNAGRAPKPPGMSDAGLDRFDAWKPEHAFAIGKLLAYGLSNTLDQDILATAVYRLAPDTAKNLPLTLPSYDVFTTVTSTPAPAPGGGMMAKVPPFAGHAAPPSFDFLSFPVGGHSNNWAVSAAHSDNGRPILAGDPHQTLTSPTRFWPLHMKSTGGGGTLDVIGFAFPGTPGVELGHNAKIGWTATTNFADVMDVWSVKTDDARTVVHLGDGDHPITTRDEVIEVKGQDATTVTIEEVAGYGILLPDALLPIPRAFLVDGDGLLFNWTGFQPSRELSAYVALDRAASVDDFEAAADLLDVGAVNFVAADAAHVDYHVHAVIPDRGEPSSHPMPWRALDGMDAKSLWTGAVLGPDKLPHLRDPDRGFIVTANNDPWGFTSDGNVENDAFYYGAFYANGARAERIADELSRLVAAGKVTREDIEALQDDLHSEFSDTVLPLLATAIAAIDTEPSLAKYKGRADLVALAGQLAAWDRTMARTKGEPLAFAGLVWFAAYRAFASQLPATLFTAIAQKSPPYMLGQLRNVLADRFQASATFLPPGGKDELLVAALDDTASWLSARFGTSDVSGLRWGDFNVAGFPAAIGGTPDPDGVDGFSDTVKVCESPFFASANAPGQTSHANEASLYRMVVTFDDDGTPNASVDYARGASEDPNDPRYADQEGAWIAGDHVALPFRDADVAAHAKSSQTLRGK